MRLPRIKSQVARLVAYIALTVAIVISLNAVENKAFRHSNINRTEVAAEIRGVLHSNCVSGDKLRVILQNIISDSNTQIDKQLKAGRITAQEAKDGHAQVNKDLAQIQVLNCNSVSSKVH